jgi:hypothetical protein
MRQTMIDVGGPMGMLPFQVGVHERPFGGPLPAPAQAKSEDVHEARDLREHRTLSVRQDDIGRRNRLPS